MVEGSIKPVNPEEFNQTAPLPGNVCSEPVHLPGVQLGQGGLYEDPLTFPIPEPYPGLQIFEPAGPGIELSNVYQATHKHHIFPQQFRDWFAEKGIDVDDYTIAIDSKVHLRGVHGRGLGDLPGRWNARWAQFILANPEATSTEVGQFASELRREFGLDDLPIEPYR